MKMVYDLTSPDDREQALIVLRSARPRECVRVGEGERERERKRVFACECVCVC
jgi:hypothetical protein